MPDKKTLTFTLMDAPYEQARSTTAFRLMLAIPHLILVGGAGLGLASSGGGGTTTSVGGGRTSGSSQEQGKETSVSVGVGRDREWAPLMPLTA